MIKYTYIFQDKENLTMEEKTLRTLEFDKIREMLSQYCINDDAKALARSLIPETKIRKVQKSLADTDRALVSVYKFGSAPIMRVLPVYSSLKRAEIGGTLSAGELLNIAAVLKCTQKLKKYQSSLGDSLDEYFESLNLCDDLEHSISIAVNFPTDI